MGERVEIFDNIIPKLLFFVHYYQYREGTLKPIERIVKSKDHEHTRIELMAFSSCKIAEVQHAQIAGAVVFSTICSSLPWATSMDAHWSGPALWYCSIIFALCGVFTGAHQQLTLPPERVIQTLSKAAIEHTKERYAHRSKQDRASPYVLFIWQLPIMFLGYSVLCFLAGFCSVIVSPLAQKPQWGDDAKTVVLFFTAGGFALFCWLASTMMIPRYKSVIPGPEEMFFAESLELGIMEKNA